MRSKFRFNRWAFESLLSFLFIVSAALFFPIPASAFLALVVALAVVAIGIGIALSSRRRTASR
ncbi:MAG TPA: hypothetical protein VEO20_01825 [Thermoplasmata archaeon]|nr:hypothetical protein [Thermoplasmata archaeon]